MKKTYIKPTMENIAAQSETLLAASIPVGTPGANPGESLAPEIGGLIDDEEEL